MHNLERRMARIFSCNEGSEIELSGTNDLLEAGWSVALRLAQRAPSERRVGVGNLERPGTIENSGLSPTASTAVPAASKRLAPSRSVTFGKVNLRSKSLFR